jgi:hypothetical protein
MPQSRIQRGPAGSDRRKTCAEPISALRVMSAMATKPLLPEVVADRAKAAEEYRRAQQAAIDRIATLRAARLARDAQQNKAQAHKD